MQTERNGRMHEKKQKKKVDELDNCIIGEIIYSGCDLQTSQGFVVASVYGPLLQVGLGKKTIQNVTLLSFYVPCQLIFG